MFATHKLFDYSQSNGVVGFHWVAEIQYLIDCSAIYRPRSGAVMSMLATVKWVVQYYVFIEVWCQVIIEPVYGSAVIGSNPGGATK